jgi:hypothetical protein
MKLKVKLTFGYSRELHVTMQNYVLSLELNTISTLIFATKEKYDVVRRSCSVLIFWKFALLIV